MFDRITISNADRDFLFSYMDENGDGNLRRNEITKSLKGTSIYMFIDIFKI